VSVQRFYAILLHDTFMIEDVPDNSHSSSVCSVFLLLNFGNYTLKGIQVNYMMS